MRSNKAVLGLVVLVVVAVSVVSACGGATPEPAQPVSIDAEALLQERCTQCHGLNQTTSARKSREEWDQTVTRMVSKGANLNDEEQTVLIDYLAQTYGP